MITRRVQQGNIPLPSAKKDPTGEFYVASLELKDLMEAQHPEENIPILPHDIVSVPVAEMVYVMGEVTKPGGFALGNKREMSVSSALAMAGGLTRTADWTGGKVMRSTHGDGHAYKEFPVNIRNIFAGKEQDFQLQAEDIVFVPSSAAKTAKMRAIEAAIQVATGVAIWSSR
jgi:polysaccharide export outer membrane protein